MANMFCTMALGSKHAGFARFLADDLKDYGQSIVILTDHPKLFRRCPNVIIKEHYPELFSYHDKRFALRSALELENTAIFVDSDCVVRFGVPMKAARESLAFDFPAGFHGWHIGSAERYEYRHFEELASDWGLKFNRNAIVYQEILFAITREGGRESFFFEIWDRFAKEARSRGQSGAGEGTCFGIAAQASMTCHGTVFMDESQLKHVFWHTRLNWKLRKLYRAKYKLKHMLTLTRPSDWRELEMCGPINDVS